MRTTWFESGDWSAICDVCGFKFKASELRLRWDGMRVCEEDHELRHPQDLIRPLPDQPALPWTRPEAPDSFVEGTVCTISSRQGVADFGAADCAMVEYDLGYR